MRKTCGKYLPKDEYCPAIFCSIPFFHEQKSGFFVVSADWKKRDWWLQMNPPLKRTLHCLLSNWLHATPQPQEKIDAELFCKTVTKKSTHLSEPIFSDFFFKWSSFFLHPPIFLIFFVVSLELRSRYQKIPFVTNQNCDSLKKSLNLGCWQNFFRKQESCWKSLVRKRTEEWMMWYFSGFLFRLSLFVISRFLHK